jgi:hypothetical protein
MKEEIRKEVMKVFNQEDDVDNVVDNILRLFDVSGRSKLLLSFGEFMSKQPFMISKRRMPEYIEEFLKANNSH